MSLKAETRKKIEEYARQNKLPYVLLDMGDYAEAENASIMMLDAKDRSEYEFSRHVFRRKTIRDACEHASHRALLVRLWLPVVYDEKAAHRLVDSMLRDVAAVDMAAELLDGESVEVESLNGRGIGVLIEKIKRIENRVRFLLSCHARGEFDVGSEEQRQENLRDAVRELRNGTYSAEEEVLAEGAQ